MVLEAIHRDAVYLRPGMEELEKRLGHMIRSGGCLEDIACLLEKHMSLELDYDLVFRDTPGNLIGIQVGAEEGPTVILRSRADLAAGSVPSIVAHVDSGHILGSCSGMWRGMVVTACCFDEEEPSERADRELIEHSLSRLGIDTGPVLAPSPGHDITEAAFNTAAIAIEHLLAQ